MDPSLKRRRPIGSDSDSDDKPLSKARHRRTSQPISTQHANSKLPNVVKPTDAMNLLYKDLNEQNLAKLKKAQADLKSTRDDAEKAEEQHQTFVKLFETHREELKSKISKLQEQASANDKKIFDLEAQVNACHAKIFDFSIKEIDFHRQINEKDDIIAKISNDMRRIEMQHSECSKRIKELEQRTTKLNAEIKEHRCASATKEEQLKQEIKTFYESYQEIADLNLLIKERNDIMIDAIERRSRT